MVLSGLAVLTSSLPVHSIVLPRLTSKVDPIDPVDPVDLSQHSTTRNFTGTVYTAPNDVTETSCFYVDNLSLNIMVVNNPGGVKYVELSFNDAGFNLTFNELVCTQSWPAVCNLTCVDKSRFYIELVLENTSVTIFYALPTGNGRKTFSFERARIVGEGHEASNQHNSVNLHNYVRRTPNSLSFAWPRSRVNRVNRVNPVNSVSSETAAEQPAFIFIFCILLGVVLGLLIFVFLKRRRRNVEPLLPV